MKEWFKKHKKLCIIIVVIIVIIALIGGCNARVGNAALQAAAELSTSDVAVIEKRALTESVSATGKVAAVDSATVTAMISGLEITGVSVEVGDMVTEGDEICTLDTSLLQEQLDQANLANTVTQELNRANLENANNNLNYALGSQYLANTQSSENIAANNAQIAELQQKIADADSEIADLKAKQEKVSSNTTEYAQYASEIASLEAQKESIESTIKSYQSTGRSLSQNGDTISFSSANNVAVARNNLWITTLNTLTNGSSNVIAAHQYEDQIEKGTVYAPISGTVTSVVAKEGALYSGGTIVTIEDESSFEVTSEISEYDISKIEVGQHVIIKTNGTGDAELEGTVTEIAPKATASASSSLSGSTVSSTSGDVTYQIKISVDTTNEDLKLDMTAKLNIIIDEKDNVLAVPYDAIQTDDNGDSYIEILEEKENATIGEDGVYTIDGKTYVTKQVPVTKGMESDYYVEVSGDGIEEGVTVMIPREELSAEELMVRAMGGF